MWYSGSGYPLQVRHKARPPILTGLSASIRHPFGCIALLDFFVSYTVIPHDFSKCVVSFSSSRRVHVAVCKNQAN
jgi:hypothetical protein